MNRRLLIALIFLMILATSCGENQENAILNSKILNGTEVTSLAAPQFVKISFLYEDQSTGFCSATAISSDTFLTAAHCFVGDPLSMKIETTNIELEVLEVIRHPDFRVDLNLQVIFNDVALVRTPKHNIPAMPILLKTISETPFPVLIYGYSLADDNTYGKLRAGTITIAESTENHLISTPFDRSLGANPCFGDSGASALASIENQDQSSTTGIIGILSTGTRDDCQTSDISFFSSLQNASALAFIIEHCQEAVILKS